MTQVELLHRLKGKVSDARYVSLTPGYDKAALDKELEQIEHYTNELLKLREQEG